MQVDEGSQGIPWVPRLFHMTDWAEARLAELRSQFPECDVWYVRCATTRDITWHAKPKGSAVATVHASAPKGLAAAIREQTEGPAR